MTGPMQGPDGKEIPPTGKSFEVEFCTGARWDNEQIVEENLFYDLVTFMKQIGLNDTERTPVPPRTQRRRRQPDRRGEADV